jgi:hypothetical protein
MAISAIGGAATYQAYQGVSAAQAAQRNGQARSAARAEPADASPAPQTPARPLTDRVTLSNAVQAPNATAAEPKIGAPKTGEAARTAELGSDRRQSAIESLKDQSRVIAQDSGGQAAGRLHVVA